MICNYTPGFGGRIQCVENLSCLLDSMHVKVNGTVTEQKSITVGKDRVEILLMHNGKPSEVALAIPTETPDGFTR